MPDNPHTRYSLKSHWRLVGTGLALSIRHVLGRSSESVVRRSRALSRNQTYEASLAYLNGSPLQLGTVDRVGCETIAIDFDGPL